MKFINQKRLSEILLIILVLLAFIIYFTAPRQSVYSHLLGILKQIIQKSNP